jgi:hypothetical protein
MPNTEGQLNVINPDVWEYVSGLVMWGIWKARCLQVFQGVIEPLIETIKIIWSELAVHTLKGQWDYLNGTSERLLNLRLRFRKSWDDLRIYNYCHGKVKWNFYPPLFLFQP